MSIMPGRIGAVIPLARAWSTNASNTCAHGLGVSQEVRERACRPLSCRQRYIWIVDGKILSIGVTANKYLRQNKKQTLA